ncbi:hypothetical protein [Streptomyces rishiriensis]|uniref:hypothetical protein n=1 Tax=Streptomyces rishiriensis TaxID=68264 RepID=UPI001FECA0A3|nr:hypothetical protein [Streptomyces rishiriensis]
MQAAVVPETFLRTTVAAADGASRRRKRQPKGPGDQVRVREMLSYLAATLPGHTGAATRLLAVQCALRMNADGQVRLPIGVLHSLRLGRDLLPWTELEQARCLRRTPACPGSESGGTIAQILDGGLFAQHPARPDRRKAADWALRMATVGGVSAGDPALRLTALCLAAHTDFSVGHGCVEADRIAHECGFVPEALTLVLGRLATSLASWSVALDSGDLRWELPPGLV